MSSVHGIFCRFEGYALVAAARKTGANTLEKIASEAMRVSGSCDHVQCPCVPAVIYGESPLLLIPQIKERACEMVSLYWHNPSKKFRSRRQRVDRPVVVAGVISVPSDWSRSESRWQEFKDGCVEWLKETFGVERLRSVVEHLDESCLHLHVFLVPRDGEDICSVHPGFNAQGRLGAGTSPRERKSAYQSAMRNLLDSFHERVGRRFGLVRRHIGARRMTRQEWHVWKWYRDRAQRQQEMVVERERAANDFRLDASTDPSAVVSRLSQGIRDLDLACAPSQAKLTAEIASQGGFENAVSSSEPGAIDVSGRGFLVSAKKAKSIRVNSFTWDDGEAGPGYAWIRPRQS